MYLGSPDLEDPFHSHLQWLKNMNILGFFFLDLHGCSKSHDDKSSLLFDITETHVKITRSKRKEIFYLRKQAKK